MSDVRFPPNSAGLTHREWEITGLVAQGLTDREIAVRLAISPATVHNHLMHAYQKLSVHSRLELVLSYQQMSSAEN